MEASQASEAGSIPVARSSPARPRAGRFCYAHFAPTVDRMRRDNRRNTLPARVGARGSGTKLALHARHATSSGTKLAPHEPHGATSGTKLAPHEPHGTSSGTKLAQQAQNLPIWRVLCAQGEFCPATTSNKTVTPPLPVQNSPCTSCTVPVPVQNSPCTPKISQFGAFCSCWESFIPFLLLTSRAWRVFSRTNTSTTTGTKETTPPITTNNPQNTRPTKPDQATQTAPHNETFIAPARHKQQKFTHFHHAGANFLSQHTPHTHTRATFLSTNASASKKDPNKTFIIFDSVITSRPDRTDIANGGPVATRRSSALDTTPMHQIAQHCTGN